MKELRRRRKREDLDPGGLIRRANDASANLLSSTTATFIVASITFRASNSLYVSIRESGQNELESRASIRILSRPDPAAMIFNDGTNDGQPHPHS